MLFQSALLHIDLEQKTNSQATMQLCLASNPRAASQWWHSRLLQTKEYRCHASSPVYVPLSLLHLKLVRQLQQHFGNINKQVEVQTHHAEPHKLFPAGTLHLASAHWKLIMSLHSSQKADEAAV